MPTPNLAIEYLAAAQAQPEIIVNEAIDAIERGLSGLAVIDLTGATFPLALSAEQGRQLALRFTGTQSGAVIEIPARPGLWIAVNRTGAPLDLRHPGQASAVTLAAGAQAIVFSDGQEVMQ